MAARSMSVPARDPDPHRPAGTTPVTAVVGDEHLPQVRKPDPAGGDVAEGELAHERGSRYADFTKVGDPDRALFFDALARGNPGEARHGPRPGVGQPHVLRRRCPAEDLIAQRVVAAAVPALSAHHIDLAALVPSSPFQCYRLPEPAGGRQA
jgi:hypothetical protein